MGGYGLTDLPSLPGQVPIRSIAYDTLANRPAANAQRGFFWQTDKKHLSFDDGVWNEFGTGLQLVPANNFSTGNGTASSPFVGWDTAINWALGWQVVYFPQVRSGQVTYYGLSSGVSITGSRTYLLGDSQGGSFILWTGASGTAFTFSNGASEYNYGGMEDIGFAANDTTSTKTFCKLTDCGLMRFRRIISTQNAWTGGTSIGFEVAGREFITFADSSIYADIPLQIEPNPNVASESFDHSSVVDCNLVCNSSMAGACINVVTGSVLSNASFVRVSLVLGQYGFHFTDSTAATTSYNVLIDSGRFEQSAAAGGWAVALDLTGVANMQNFTLNDFYIGGTGGVTNGIKLRKCLMAHLAHIMGAVTSPTALDADNTNTMVWVEGGWSQPTSTMSIGSTVRLVSAGTSFVFPNGIPAARVYNNAAITLTTGVVTPLTFNTERYNTNGMHSLTLNTSRLTCVTSGLYRLFGHVRWASNAVGDRQVGLRLNGATFIAFEASAPDATTVTVASIATEFRLTVGDYVELTAYQSSGGNLNVDSSGDYSPEFGCSRIGD